MNTFLRSAALACLVIGGFFTAPASAQTDSVYVETYQTEPCWVQYSQSFYTWNCAGSVLPPEGQPYALSIGLVAGENSVALIDSGATALVGEQLAADVKRKFPEQKIFVINTQPKPEHVLGNIGIKNFLSSESNGRIIFEGRIVSGKVTADLMRERCPQCIDRFAERMGSQAVVGTEALAPDFVLSRKRGSLRILNIEWADWQYELHDDLETEEVMVLSNRVEGIYWVGNVVQKTMVPDLFDGKVSSRLDYLYQLSTHLRSGELILTAHGPVSTDWLNRNVRYFKDLQIDVMLGIEGGTSEVELINQLSEVLEQSLPNMTAKDLETHQLNIQRAYRELETLMM